MNFTLAPNIAQGEGIDMVAVQKRLWQFFWGAQQRFFKAMGNSAKVVILANKSLPLGRQLFGLSVWISNYSWKRRVSQNLISAYCHVRKLIETMKIEQSSCWKLFRFMYSGMLRGNA